MNRYITAVLAAILALVLSACSGDPSNELPSESALPTKTLTLVPDVGGSTPVGAKTLLITQGFKVEFLSSNGARWNNEASAAYAKVVASDPAAGTQVETGATVKIQINMTESAASVKMAAAQEAEAEAKALATRYSFSCGTTGYGADHHIYEYHSYSEVWASENYSDIDTCNVKVVGESTSKDVELRDEEQRIVNILAEKGGDASIPSWAFESTLALCAKPPFDYPNSISRSSRSTQAQATAALALCPEAPHASLLQQASTTFAVKDGTFVVGVGEEMEPGVYQTGRGVKDCYWSRTTGAGDIIANDFIGFAPEGVTVTVYAGEGFESSSCHKWTRVG